MSEKSTLEDVRIISLEGQVALQKIELEKLSSNLEEHRWDAAAIHHCFLYSQSKNELKQLSVEFQTKILQSWIMPLALLRPPPPKHSK